MELSTLVVESPTDNEFISFAKQINTNASINIAVHKIVSIEGDETKYNNASLINGEG